MPATTATVVTARQNGKADGNITLRGALKDDSPAPTAAAIDEKEYEHFFWTYTEEPHRTRRMAIIKAHPEVRAPSLI
jgi:hypothetical protein